MTEAAMLGEQTLTLKSCLILLRLWQLLPEAMLLRVV